jgi:hypothetical protein
MTDELEWGWLSFANSGWLTMLLTFTTYVLQQFKDIEDGMEANLRIWCPAACPPIYLEEHAEHYAVEFRNGCRMAAAAQDHQP